MRGIYKRVKFIFTTFCRIIHMKICRVHIIYLQLCVIFFLMELRNASSRRLEC